MTEHCNFREQLVVYCDEHILRPSYQSWHPGRTDFETTAHVFLYDWTKKVVNHSTGKVNSNSFENACEIAACNMLIRLGEVDPKDECVLAKRKLLGNTPDIDPLVTWRESECKLSLTSDDKDQLFMTLKASPAMMRKLLERRVDGLNRQLLDRYHALLSSKK